MPDLFVGSSTGSKHGRMPTERPNVCVVSSEEDMIGYDDRTTPPLVSRLLVSRKRGGNTLYVVHIIMLLFINLH